MASAKVLIELFVRMVECSYLRSFKLKGTMKIFYAEYMKDYSTYTFSYVPYVVFRSTGEMTEIYDGGFLPYTGNIHLDHHIYYKSRSLRINLNSFEPGSENRRVDRKFENLEISVKWIPIHEFPISDTDFLGFCNEYSNQRFKGGEMGLDRLQFILKSPFLTDIIEFQLGGKLAGYVFVGQNNEMVHYWYSFYELEAFQELPLGKFMMLEIIRQSQQTDRKYCYLGTCYGAHSLYKVRDFKGVEFNDGTRWSTDVNLLKEWCKTDDSPLEMDRFKQLAPEEANRVIQHILNS